MESKHILAEYARSYYLMRKRLGLCVKCGRKAEAGSRQKASHVVRSKTASPKVSQSTQVGCTGLPEETQRDGPLRIMSPKGVQSGSLSKALPDDKGKNRQSSGPYIVE